MQRIFGAIAIFAGWLSIGISAMAGLVYSEFFGLSHVEGAVPPSAVYGVSGLMILWVIVAAALLTSVPMASAIVAADPRRNLRLLAGAMAITGIVLLPDELGRAFGVPLFGGAVCLWIGAELIYRETLAAGLAAPIESGPAVAGEPAIAASTATPHVPATPGAPAAESVPAISTDTAASRVSAAAIASVAVEPAPAPVPTASPAVGETGKRRRRGSGRATPIAQQICPWCSTAIPTDVAVCPNCRAALDGAAAEAIPIPGLTEVPAGLRRYADRVAAKGGRPSLLGMIFREDSIPTAAETPPPSEPSALRPPSPELKAEMARLDAEIAAGALPLEDAETAPAETTPADSERAPTDRTDAGGPA